SRDLSSRSVVSMKAGATAIVASSTPGVTRTRGQRFRKPLLYPAELQGQTQISYGVGAVSLVDFEDRIGPEPGKISRPPARGDPETGAGALIRQDPADVRSAKSTFPVQKRQGHQERVAAELRPLSTNELSGS